MAERKALWEDPARRVLVDALNGKTPTSKDAGNVLFEWDRRSRLAERYAVERLNKTWQATS